MSELTESTKLQEINQENVENISEHHMNDTSKDQSSISISSPSDSDSNENDNSESPKKRLSKSERKLLKYQRKVAHHKAKKAEKKRLKKELIEASMASQNSESNNENNSPKDENASLVKRNYENYLNKRDLKQKTLERLNQVYTDGSSALKICIDCSFSNRMSNKELSKLAQQIGRCYATNKAVNSPVHLTLCNLDENSVFYKELCRVNDGFSNYIIKKTNQNLETLFSDKLNSLCYLSPDSKTYLETLDAEHVYVIGGLVDETVNKQVTLAKCHELKVQTFALPIEKYLCRKCDIDPDDDYKKFNYNKILAVNQVFDILAHFYTSKDWTESLERSVPKRKGFVRPPTAQQPEKTDD